MKKVAYWFYAVLLLFGSLMIISCGSKHVGIFIVVVQYKCLTSNIVHFLVDCCGLVFENSRDEQYKKFTVCCVSYLEWSARRCFT
jgi:hypothetical protein